MSRSLAVYFLGICQFTFQCGLGEFETRCVRGKLTVGWREDRKAQAVLFRYHTLIETTLKANTH